jgi:hypothetical protein
MTSLARNVLAASAVAAIARAEPARSAQLCGSFVETLDADGFHNFTFRRHAPQSEKTPPKDFAKHQCVTLPALH